VRIRDYHTRLTQLYLHPLSTGKPTNSAQEAAKKMKDKNVSSLVVADEKGKPQAIVSERGLV
jgi:signal-transduction protein with cAMP-binding, CBS, and nucleotidyltransferase domain